VRGWRPPTAGSLEGEVARLSASIDAAAREDVGKPYSDERHDKEAQFLKEFARQRPAFVLQEIARARAGR
jgi:hypothetical protein